MNISHMENLVCIDGQVADKKDIIIEIMDYGDQYFDVHFTNITTNNLFGESAFCGIHTKTKAMKKAKEVCSLAGLKQSQIMIVEQDEMEVYY